MDKVKLSNLHKIGKYGKETGEKSGNYQHISGNWNFHIVRIYTASASASDSVTLI